MDRPEDSRQEPLEETGLGPEGAPAPEDAIDAQDALEAQPAAGDEAEAFDDAWASAVEAPDEPSLEADAAPMEGQDDALDLAPATADDEARVDATQEPVGLTGDEDPARLREDAERLLHEAQARQQAAAELRQEAARLREEAVRLLEQPQELQAEVARLREEARAAQGMLVSGPEAEPGVDLEEPVYEEAITDVEEPTTELGGERRRSWLRRRRG